MAAIEGHPAKRSGGTLALVWCQSFVEGDVELVSAEVDTINGNINEGSIPRHVVLDACGTSTKFVSLQVPISQGTVDGHGERCCPRARASSTGPIARIVAAVTVDAASADALAINGATVSVGLLVGTLVVVVAPVTWYAVSVLEAERTALLNVVAHVR